MQIILISDRLARARSVHMSLRHLVGSAFVALLLIFGATATLYWLTLRYAAEVRLPALQQLVAAAQEAEAERERQFLQQNLNSMAMKLGEMQAQLTRMDALGERLSHLAGIRPQEFKAAEAPGLGGAAPTQLPPQNLSLGDFSEKDRTFMVLYYARGLEAEEVAEEMQISLKTVYSKKHKIRAHLRRCLEERKADSALADLAAAAAAA